jgi:hypothetical protein
MNENGGFANWSMIKLETCYCASNLEARKRERWYYEELNASMNMIRPYRTSEDGKKYDAECSRKNYIHNKAKIQVSQKQWQITNKDKMIQYRFENKDKQKEYNELNKERIAAQVSRRIHCKICDCYQGKGNMARHVKCKIHLKKLEIENSASKMNL